MSREEKCKFKRTMNEELKKKLIEEPLYKQLLPDIKDGEVFPAIRKGRDKLSEGWGLSAGISLNISPLGVSLAHFIRSSFLFLIC